MNKRLLLLSVVGLTGLSRSAQADIAPDPMSGGISLEVPGHSPTTIVLLHNTVKLRISPTLCRTRAFFRLQNTGPTTELEVGFPLIHEGEASDFQVFVDHAPVSFQNKAKEDVTPIGQKYMRRWKVWDMRFKAEQTHLVEVRYSNPPALGWSPTLQSVFYPAFREWQTTGVDYNVGDYGYIERVDLHEWLAIKTVSYILVSGSYWKGPIQRCRVEADIANVPTDSLIEVQPPAKSFSPQHIVWEWQNVEPARNVSLTFLGASPRLSIPYLEKIAARNPQDEALSKTLDLIKQDFPGEQKTRERLSTFVQH